MLGAMQGWSFNFIKLAGIQVRVHLTLLLVIIWYVVSAYRQVGEWGAALQHGLLACLLFAIVVFHELAHALTARRFGVQTRDILLLPIGGVARMEKMPEKPWQELWVAIAGPAFNLALAALLGIWQLVMYGVWPSFPASAAEGDALAWFHLELSAQLYFLNLILALFNLLPAFPMDGGRVLRAIFAMFWPRDLATRRAAMIGKIFAILLGWIGLQGNLVLVLIAVFVWFGAGEEAEWTTLKMQLRDVPVSKIMFREFRYLHPHAPIQEGAALLLEGFQHDFPVIDTEGRFHGIVSRVEILKAVADQEQVLRVKDCMHEAECALPHMRVADVVEMMSKHGDAIAAVLEAGRVVGVISLENIGEYAMLDDAKHHRPPSKLAHTLSAS